jgi:hypothetical protein
MYHPPFETKLKNNHKVTVHFLSFFVCGLWHRRRRTRLSAPAVAPVWGDHPSASHKSTPLTQVGLPVSFLLLFFRGLTFEKRLSLCLKKGTHERNAVAFYLLYVGVRPQQPRGPQRRKVKKTRIISFARFYILKMPSSFYQDRLGTNIGRKAAALIKRDDAFSAGRGLHLPPPRVRPHAGKKTRLFARFYILKIPSFYQDRLGTNIGRKAAALKRQTVFLQLPIEIKENAIALWQVRDAPTPSIHLASPRF